MATKKKPVQETVEANLEWVKTAFIDSVIDWKLTKVEWYITDTPINDTSKLIRYQEDGKHPENKFFTKK